MTRTRTRELTSSFAGYDAVTNNWNNLTKTWGVDKYHSASVSATSQSIQDDIGPKVLYHPLSRRVPIPVIRPVIHNQTKFTANAEETFSVIPNVSRRRVLSSNPSVAAVSYPTNFQSHLSSPSYAATWAELEDQLAGKIAGDIEPGLLSLATIGEIGSLKGLTFSLGKWLGEIRSLLKPGDFSKPLDYLRRAASVDLGWKFGVKPLISDLYAAASIVGAVQAHLNHLASFNKNIPRMITVDSSQKLGDTDVTSAVDRRFVCTNRMCTRRVFAYVTADYKINDATASYLTMQRLGLTSILGTAWELVPFSFVVDYFLRVQAWVEFMDRRLAKGSYSMARIANILGVGHTQLSVSNNTAYWRLYSTSANWVRIASWQRREYQRWNGTPLGWDSFATTLAGRGITASRGLTGLELLAVLTQR